MGKKKTVTVKGKKFEVPDGTLYCKKCKTTNFIYDAPNNARRSRVDEKNQHGVAHRKRNKDEKKREGFSLSSALEKPPYFCADCGNPLKVDTKEVKK